MSEKTETIKRSIKLAEKDLKEYRKREKDIERGIESLRVELKKSVKPEYNYKIVKCQTDPNKPKLDDSAPLFSEAIRITRHLVNHKEFSNNKITYGFYGDDITVGSVLYYWVNGWLAHCGGGTILLNDPKRKKNEYSLGLGFDDFKMPKKDWDSIYQLGTVPVKYLNKEGEEN